MSCRCIAVSCGVLWVSCGVLRCLAVSCGVLLCLVVSCCVLRCLAVISLNRIQLPKNLRNCHYWDISQLRNLFVTKSFEENPNLHGDNEDDRDFNHWEKISS